jgi:hypothetical protein
MSSRTDTELRAALADLTAGPPPRGLAAAAVDRAVHLRRRRNVGRFAAAVAVIPLGVAAVAVAQSLSGPAAAPPPPVSVKPPRPAHVVSAYSGVWKALDPQRPSGASWNDATSFLLNFETGEYEEVPYYDVDVSPDGTTAFVAQARESPDLIGVRHGLLDRATGEVRWLPSQPGYVTDVDWSADGRRMLVTDASQDREGFAIVDLDTLATTFVPAAGTATADGEYSANVRWAADGESVMLVLGEYDEPKGRHGIPGIRYWNTDGDVLRTVPLSGLPAPAHVTTSPDGTRIMVSKEGRHWLVDPTTGSKRLLRFKGFVTGWVDETHVVVRVNVGHVGADGRVEARIIDVTTGRKTGEVPTPDLTASHVGELVISSSAGLSDKAAKEWAF